MQGYKGCLLGHRMSVSFIFVIFEYLLFCVVSSALSIVPHGQNRSIRLVNQDFTKDQKVFIFFVMLCRILNINLTSLVDE